MARPLRRLLALQWPGYKAGPVGSSSRLRTGFYSLRRSAESSRVQTQRGATDFMKPSSWDKQLGLALPRESAASQSDQTNNPSKDEVRDEVGLDVSHHARISQRGGANFFYLTSFFIG
jgi:hypothetical protein